ncbi:hypothetical protein MCAP1_002175 [Malassezia caprae]|uniref:Programmed cell death protein 2 C-terminal domain-containing protein n=1 Tax=Malassezia caprae TaxID=1381934 RepID=A0AAF0E6I8_9BASI|nr:hypothetical protein MCAP1_002175 [Malassezia caprae]
MPPPYDDDSDFESDEEFSEVQLGLADGPLESEDEANPLVSRIGGRPVWLPLAPSKLPPASLVQCQYCKKPMQLLVQIFAPLENSAFDRNLFVWGCSRAACQRKGPGSIKAVRMLKHNQRWAAKLAKQAERQRIRKEREEAKRRAEAEAESRRLTQERTTNPFKMGSGGAGSLLGESLFGASPLTTVASPAPPPVEESEEEDDEADFDEDERLAEELAIKASLEEQRAQLQEDWTRSTSHYTTSLYLNTIPEPRRAEDNQPTSQTPVPVKETSTGGEGEVYEQMTIDGIDDVYEQFTRRLGTEARQVVRYEYEGTPLPFSAAGPLFKQLWPSGWRGPMDTSSIPPCPHCGAPRVFELQLMPNLANLLRVDKLSDAGSIMPSSNTEEHRQAEISSLLGLKDTHSDMCTGIVWSTALVFVCSRDCCPDTEGWAEEWVGLQHEGDL